MPTANFIIINSNFEIAESVLPSTSTQPKLKNQSFAQEPVDDDLSDINITDFFEYTDLINKEASDLFPHGITFKNLTKCNGFNKPIAFS